jgi:hypothetical protein
VTFLVPHAIGPPQNLDAHSFREDTMLAAPRLAMWGSSQVLLSGMLILMSTNNCTVKQL